jgi:hypothetical protein
MHEPITIKLSTDADRQRIADLADLDGKRPPTGDVLLAEVQGRLVAAIGMDGTAIADPFERTASVMKVLRTQIAGEPGGARRRRGWLRGLLPAR